MERHLLILAVLCACAIGTFALQVDEGYALLIDAGSTGSRAFIYALREESEEGETIARTVNVNKGKKVMNGLSTYVESSPQEILDYLSPIFVNASAQIPQKHWKSTQVFIKGTAGMRLLPEESQEKLWSMLVEHLNKDERNPFPIVRENLGTIDGDSEAYYAALSSNYIAKSIDGNLKRVPGVEMVGALDMGGSSTQVIVHKSTEKGQAVKAEDFWSYSWLNYGVEKVRERMEERLVAASSSNTVENPCAPAGHSVLLGRDRGTTLVGSGHAEGCYEALTEVMWEEKSCAAASYKKSLAEDEPPCYIMGVEHPPLKGKFYAMSVYFYALDAVHQLGQEKIKNWPRPTIRDLKEAVYKFCAADWAEAQAWLNRAHRYTQDRNVPNRCVEAMYMVTLLEYGFGYDLHSRDITFALNIEGREVEWTLGFVLANVGVRGKEGLNEQVRPSSSASKVPSSGSSVVVAGLNRARGLMASFRSLLLSFLSRLALQRPATAK